MKRQKYPARTITLSGELQRQTLLTVAANLPVDSEQPLECVIREKQPVRKMSQNDLMWVNQLACIAEQAYILGRTYSADIWHVHFKTLYLPEQYDEDLTKEGYAKWDYTPSGERTLVGSTKQLTVKGFAQYLTQIEAGGASMGVMFSANPNGRMR